MTPKDAASILPRKTEGELTSVDDNGSFSMYALVFGNVDRQGDLIEANAVTNVDELTKDGWIALNHDQTAMPIAMIDSAVQDSRGLMLSGRFHSHPKAQEVRSYVKERLSAGKAVKTSIGYLVPVDGERYERDDGRTVRHISKMSVYEASFVNLPANPEAEVVAAKSLGGPDAAESEEEMSAAAVLKDIKRVLGLSKKGMYKADGEDVEKLRGMQKAVDAHADACVAQAKSLKTLGEAHKALAGEMDKCLKNFTGGQQQSQADDNDGDVADEDEDDDTDKEKKSVAIKKSSDEDTDEDEAKAKKKAKAKKRRKEDDEEEDKEDDEDDKEEKALKAFRNDLQRRALALKYPNRAG